MGGEVRGRVIFWSESASEGITVCIVACGVMVGVVAVWRVGDRIQ